MNNWDKLSPNQGLNLGTVTGDKLSPNQGLNLSSMEC